MPGAYGRRARFEGKEVNGKADSGPVTRLGKVYDGKALPIYKGVTEVSKAGLEKLVTAMADESFRRKVKENPEAALAGYDLTPEEKAAIKSGNTAKLRELGVDERITKSAIASGWFGDEGSGPRQ